MRYLKVMSMVLCAALVGLHSPFSHAALGGGLDLQVKVDGQTVLPSKIILGTQPGTLHAGPGGEWIKVKGQFKLFIDYNKEKLGDLKRCEVWVQTVRDMDIDQSSLTIPDEPYGKEYPIGQDVLIKRWDHFMQKQDHLAPGKYQLTIMVNGSRLWDGMNIAFEVVE